MRAGTLRHRIRIEEPTLDTADTYGAQAADWDTVADCESIACEVSTLNGVEAFRMKQVQPEATTQVTMRYHNGLTTAMRFIFGTRTLYPISMVEDEKNRQLVFLCREQR